MTDEQLLNILKQTQIKERVILCDGELVRQSSWDKLHADIVKTWHT